MSIASSEELDAVFGLESEGDTPEERSLTSKREFVRSQHQISIRQPDAPGRWFRANEILRLFGWETLRVLAARPASPVLRRGADPVSDLRKQIDALGVSEGGVLSRANVSEVGKRALKSKSQVPFADLEKLAQHLSLDSDLLGLGSEQPEVSRLSVRLRTIGSGPRALSEVSVLALAEAAWVIGRQHALQNMLEHPTYNWPHDPNSDYGSSMTPAWRVGQRLAELTRETLEVQPGAPIESMTRLLEERLNIPVVHVRLPKEFAGATIASGTLRGIVVNQHGANENVWVRRMTLAHELGHYLWDSQERLEQLVVDRHADLQSDYSNIHDPVEQRANSFAVEFLAPRTEAGDVYKSIVNSGSSGSEGIEAVMRQFNIGPGAASHHVRNELPQFEVPPGPQGLQPTDDIKGLEEFSVSFFDPNDVPESRRGRFARLVGEAHAAQLISDDTVAAYLSIPRDKVETALTFINTIQEATPSPS